MEKIIAPSGLPRDIPLSVLLGLSSPEGVDWGRIRALQFNGIQQHGLLKIIAAIVCGLLTLQWGIGQINLMFLGLWFSALAMLCIYSHLWSRKQLAWQRKTVDRAETRMVNFLSPVDGLIWGAGFLLFAFEADLMTVHSLWAMMICLMVGSAMIFSAIPLSSILFISALSAALSFGWFHVGSLDLAVASLAIAVLLISACLKTGRSFIERRVSEASLNEKSEVVSLLLKEFEDTGADWLWQTDTSRRITHVSPRFAHAIGQRRSCNWWLENPGKAGNSRPRCTSWQTS